MIPRNGIVLFNVNIGWFAPMVVLGVLAGLLIASWYVKQRGEPSHVIWRTAPWAIIGAFIGSRLWFALFPPQSMVEIGFSAEWFFTHFFDLNQGVTAVYNGGLALFGATIGASIMVWWRTRRDGTFILWWDALAIVFAAAQIFGYIGSINEIYGQAASWGIHIPDAAWRVTPYTDLERYPLATTLFLPVFIFEALLSAGVLAVLLLLPVRFPGDRVLLYMLCYGAGRFLLESFRVNVSTVGGFNVHQVIAGVVTLIASTVLFTNFVRRGRLSRRV
jgi:phosphatidylglycerol---prolipoprotein diacylglyceryl transferase